MSQFIKPENADIRYANLGNADLSGANLEDAQLHGSILTGANVHSANLNFSSIPLWHGMHGIKADKSLGIQLVKIFNNITFEDEDEYSIHIKGLMSE